MTSEVSTGEVSRKISRAMQKLSISYTKAINKRCNRVGGLFQGQFQFKPIKIFSHLLNLCLYIHSNPGKEGLAAFPEEWEYSNYLEWVNKREGTLVNRKFIDDNFGTTDEYNKMVNEHIKTKYLPEELQTYLQSLE